MGRAGRSSDGLKQSADMQPSVHSPLLFLPLIFCVCQFDHITSHICSLDVWAFSLRETWQPPQSRQKLEHWQNIKAPQLKAWYEREVNMNLFKEQQSQIITHEKYFHAFLQYSEPRSLPRSGSQLCCLLTLTGLHFHPFTCDNCGLGTGLNLQIWILIILPLISLHVGLPWRAFLWLCLFHFKPGTLVSNMTKNIIVCTFSPWL